MGWSFDGGDWARIADGRAEFRNADGTWSVAAAPEHAESLSYLTRAVDDPAVDKLVAYQRAGGSLNAEQEAFFSNPLIGLDSFGQGYRWGAIDLFDAQFSAQQSGALLQTGGGVYLTDADKAGGAAFNQEQSPAAQAARSGSDSFGDFLTIAAMAVAAYFAGPAAFAAEAGSVAAAEAAATYSTFEGFATVAAESVVSPSTWAAFGTEASTAGMYANATAAAVNTTVADYAAAAVAGEATGAATAFSYLPVSSLGPAVSAGFLESALEVAKGVKKAVDTVRIVNTATQQQSIVPRNAPVPVGWAVDAGWSPSLGDSGAKYSYDPATGALMLQSSTSPEAAAVVPAAGTVSPVLVLAALAGAVFFLVK